MRGTPYLFALSPHCLGLGLGQPPTAQNTATIPSRTRRLRSTSTVKSTWPGVSMMLMRQSRHWQKVAADVIVMPRSFSWTIQSIVAAPLMYLADAMHPTSVEEDALRRRRLAGVDVRCDPDVPGIGQCLVSCFCQFCRGTHQTLSHLASLGASSDSRPGAGLLPPARGTWYRGPAPAESAGASPPRDPGTTVWSRPTYQR